MKISKQERLHHQITQDLMKKLAADVDALMKRTLSIAPQPFLPIMVQGCASMLTYMVMDLTNDEDGLPFSDEQVAILAALIVSRCHGHRDLQSAMEMAREDIMVLAHAGRIEGVGVERRKR
jgi:hypothetical protein